jgi:hypothetical protein
MVVGRMPERIRAQERSEASRRCLVLWDIGGSSHVSAIGARRFPEAGDQCRALNCHVAFVTQGNQFTVHASGRPEERAFGASWSQVPI